MKLVVSGSTPWGITGPPCIPGILKQVIRLVKFCVVSGTILYDVPYCPSLLLLTTVDIPGVYVWCVCGVCVCVAVLCIFANCICVYMVCMNMCVCVCVCVCVHGLYAYMCVCIKVFDVCKYIPYVCSYVYACKGKGGLHFILYRVNIFMQPAKKKRICKQKRGEPHDIYKHIISRMHKNCSFNHVSMFQSIKKISPL